MLSSTVLKRSLKALLHTQRYSILHFLLQITLTIVFKSDCEVELTEQIN